MIRHSQILLATSVVFAAWATMAYAAPPAALKPEERLEKSPRHHEWAEITTASGRKLKAFVVFPEVSKPVPGVVVIHENRGLNDWARSLADQLAEAGYVAVAPDMLSGTGPDGGATDSFKSADDARGGIYKLTPEQVQSDLAATIAYTRKLDATNDKVAVAGFCWGGGQAFAAALHQGDIAAAFVFYGTAPARNELEKVKVPVYGFYGGNDFRISAQVPGVEGMMKSLGKKYEAVIYKDAGHGFMRSGETAPGDSADHKGRDQAWQRWLDLLKAL